MAHTLKHTDSAEEAASSLAVLDKTVLAARVDTDEVAKPVHSSGMEH